MTPSRLRVLRAIHQERERQDAKWGGPPHDDGHSVEEWYDLLTERVEQASLAADLDRDWFAARQHLIEVAALAVAEIEALDRFQETEILS